MKESKEMKKVKELDSDFTEKKDLKRKHFIMKDRAYLFEKLRSQENKLNNLLKLDLKKSKRNVQKLEDSKRELQKIARVVDELIIEMNQKLRTLGHQKRLVFEEKSLLSDKEKLLNKKTKKIREALLSKKEERNFFKKEMKKLK